MYIHKTVNLLLMVYRRLVCKNYIQYPLSKRFTIFFIILCLSLFQSSLSAKDLDDGDGRSLLLFPNIHADSRSGLSKNTEFDKTDFDLNLDLFYSENISEFRFLAEVFLSNDEQEIERLHVGYSTNESNLAILGRFHNPIGYWNTQFHHGTYLQSTITRPAIINFEDNNGILPTHTTGLMYELSSSTGEGAVKLSLSLGLGPEFDTTSRLLEPLDLLGFNDGKNRLSSTLRVAYQPDELGPDDVGIFFGYTTIPITGSTTGEIDQSLVGVYVNKQSGDLAITSAIYNTYNDVTIVTNNSDNFISGYLQAEYQINSPWLVYSRYEGINGSDSDPYLSLLNYYNDQSIIFGLRFDFLRKHAITLEISEKEFTNADDHTHYSLQWSAVFP